MEKKKFFETKVGAILKGVASIVSPSLIKSLEGVSSVGEALGIIRSSQSVSEETKLKMEHILLEHEKELTERLKSDNSQELWLPKLIRPLTLVCLTTAYIGGFFFHYDVSTFHPPLLMVFGFYFGGRSIEKLLKKHV